MDSQFKSVPIRSYEITSKETYLSRRDFIKASSLIAGSLALASCAPQAQTDSQNAGPTPGPSKTDELGDPANKYEEITNYNNFYEFSTNKEAVASLSQDLKTKPWTVEVTGLVSKPQKFDVDDLLKKFTQEERIYRLRCVEAWSMVIPWTGFTLASLLKEVEPLSNATHIHFVTLMDKEQFPGEGNPFYPWPYEEGLRLDEAMNDLTILATGLYGQPLPPQDGAPLRLVVPWKYGFKSIKSIVKIELVDAQPSTFWKNVAANEYGFYANVNPNVDHPRWSQASERRIGEFTRRPTLMFNGYAEQVAAMYRGMDLKSFF